MEKVLDSHFLVGFQLELLVCFAFEHFLVLCVFHKSLGDFLDDLEDSLGLISLLKICIVSLGILSIFQELGDVLLEALYLFFKVIYLFVNDIQGRKIIVSVFYLDLDKQLVVLTLFSQSLSLVQCLDLASANLNSCINIKNRVALMLLL